MTRWSPQGGLWPSQLPLASPAGETREQPYTVRSHSDSICIAYLRQWHSVGFEMSQQYSVPRRTTFLANKCREHLPICHYNIVATLMAQTECTLWALKCPSSTVYQGAPQTKLPCKCHEHLPIYNIVATLMAQSGMHGDLEVRFSAHPALLGAEYG